MVKSSERDYDVGIDEQEVRVNLFDYSVTRPRNGLCSLDDRPVVTSVGDWYWIPATTWIKVPCFSSSYSSNLI